MGYDPELKQPLSRVSDNNIRTSNEVKDAFFFNVLWNLLLMVMGSILCAIAVNSILVPQEFFGAGFTGIAIVIHYLIPFMPISFIYFILNIPVYVIG